MAQQTSTKDPGALSPTRYTEQPEPQFVGGGTDPATGNIVPAGKASYASGQTPTPPAEPTTQLAYADASPAPAPSSGPSTTQLLETAGLNLASSLGGKLAAGAFSSPKTGGSSSGSDNPLDGFQGGNGSPQSSGAGPLSTPTNGIDTAMPSSSPDYSDFKFNPPDTSSWGTQPSAPPENSFASAGGEYAGPGDSGGGGGSSKMICAELHRQGSLDGITYDADQAFGAVMMKDHPTVYAGYALWARPTVRLMQRSRSFTGFVKFIATPWAQYLSYRMGARDNAPVRGAILFHAGWAICAGLGTMMTILRRPAIAR